MLVMTINLIVSCVFFKFNYIHILFTNECHCHKICKLQQFSVKELFDIQHLAGLGIQGSVNK